MFEEGRWAVPAGPGAFLCTMCGLVASDGDLFTMVVASTWISNNLMRPEQTAQVRAILFRGPGRTLGDGLLCPSILRAVATTGADHLGRVLVPV